MFARFQTMDFIIFLMLSLTSRIIYAATSTYPPVIVQDSPTKQVMFEIGDTVQLPCVADGFPKPSYRWTFNERSYEPAGQDDRVTMLSGFGTLLFSNPRSQDEGFYKCYAKNDFGEALANTVQLINASLGNFPDAANAPIARTAGARLHIYCPKPESFPPAKIIWYVRTGLGYKLVDYNDRITVDPDGGINFAYLLPEDSSDYRCDAYNSKLRKQVSSKPFNIKVSGNIGDTQSPPLPNWNSRTSETFIRGSPASIKCVYGGRPTPGVIWARPDGRKVSVRAQVRSYGMELYFASIEYEDAGTYECSAYNEAAPTPYKQTIIVDVQGYMRWVYQPTPITVGINQSVTFICKGEGKPTPGLPMWFKNTKLITGNTDNMVIGDDYGPSTTLTIKNTKQSDTMALQCNITNGLRTSWIHSSFYLNVQSEKPLIVDFDEGPHKWAAGRTYYLTCKVFGAPTPIISWKLNGQPLTGGRFVTMQDGRLMVTNVGITDAGTYECLATNPMGYAAMSTDVVVRRRTRIRQAPEDLTVTAGTQAKFVCTGLTDPDEAQNLKIRWLKDDGPINYVKNNRVFQNVQDNSLQIAGPISLDSGTYTCVASNGIDEANASATLRVQDKPDQPTLVQIVYCRANSALLQWSPGTNNNAPLTNFIIQYQVARDLSMWYTAVSDVKDTVTQIDIPLKANNVYRFRVLAQNKIGISEPSTSTVGTCQTVEAPPVINPRGVKTVDEGDFQLVITWQPISPIDFGAQSFTYIVRWKKDGPGNCNGDKEYCERSINAQEGQIGRPGELNIIEYKIKVEAQQTYQKYKITVISRNSLGDSTAPIQYTYGFSGEGNPKQIVTGLAVALSSNGTELVEDDSVTLIWNAVDESDEQTQGFFRGYVIQYQKVIENSNEVFDARSIYIIIRDDKQEGNPNYEQRKLQTNQYDAIEDPKTGKVSVKINNLPANSKLNFQIAVLSRRRYGVLAPNPPLQITTKEGAPGSVQQLRIKEYGPTHVRLEWERPIEPNGIIRKYVVGYKFLNGLHLGPLQFPDEPSVDAPADPTVVTSTAKVTGLKPLQMYRFYVWAYTSVMQGSEYFLDDSTVAAGYPGAPKINVVRLEDNTLNVSWVPSGSGVPANVFYVQYKQESAIDNWQRTGWETNRYYIIVSNFVEGWRYEIRVVASNGGIYETASESVKIFPTAISRSAAEARQVFSSAWFIGLLITLLIAAFIIFMMIYSKRNRGGYQFSDFNAEETEPLKGHGDSAFDEKSGRSPDAHDDAPISERYAPSHFSERYPTSQPTEKFLPTPTQEEYMQDDPGRYGEEGSFIGQYRENRELPNVRPRMASDPYNSRVVQPQPRTRAPPSDTSGPAAAPRGGYTPSIGSASDRYAPQQPVPRQQRPVGESSNDYRPQYRQPPAASSQPDFRPRTAARSQDNLDSHSQTDV